VSNTIALHILEGIYTHNGVSMDGYGWIKHLQISNVTWARRYYQYYKSGKNPDKLFMTKSEMNEFLRGARSKAGYLSHANRSKSWCTFEERLGSETRKGHPDQIKGMYGLIAEIIKRAKANLVTISTKSKSELGEDDLINYHGAYKFLMDDNGDLSYYLDACEGIDREVAKEELKWFARGFPKVHPSEQPPEKVGHGKFNHKRQETNEQYRSSC